MRRYLIFSVIIAVILSLLLYGCSRDEKKDGNEETVSFTDALGRELTIKKDPQRVAALIGSFADVWRLAGGELVAAASDAAEDFGIDMSHMVNLGGAHSPSLELLLSVSPDLVIASASTASNVKMKESLENAKIPVVYFDVDNFYDYLEMLDICTDITGRKDLYLQNGVKIQEKIEEIKSLSSSVSLSDHERSVLLLRVSSSSVKAKGSRGTIIGEMLADLGFINVADSDKSMVETLSVESIIKSDPYRIFIVVMGDNTNAAKNNINEMINDNPALNQLSAIREGRLHYMDKRLFNLKPNIRWAEAYEVLTKILYECK